MRGAETQHFFLPFYRKLFTECMQMMIIHHYIEIINGMHTSNRLHFFFCFVQNCLLISKFVLCRHGTEVFSGMSTTACAFKQTHSCVKHD